MSDRVFTKDEQDKLTRIIKEGMQVKQEMEDLREGLKDTVTAISEEMAVSNKALNKAISVAFKGDLAKHQEDLEEVETILASTGFAR